MKLILYVSRAPCLIMYLIVYDGRFSVKNVSVEKEEIRFLFLKIFVKVEDFLVYPDTSSIYDGQSTGVREALFQTGQ